MGNIVSNLGQDDGEAGMNRLISDQDEQSREQKVDVTDGDFSSYPEGDDMAALEVLPIGRSGKSTRSAPSRPGVDRAAAATSATPPFIWATSMLPASPPMLSRDSPSPRQEALFHETEERQMLSRRNAVALETVHLQPQIEAQATRYGSSGRCSFFSWSLVLASAVLSLVSTVLGVVTWKLLGEDISFDVGQNASAMMRLLFDHNVSSDTAPRSASSDAAAGTPSDGAESVLP
ncbi:hypothetical protein ISCGN_010226 [Ixodes scapularis]